ncbi:hypothetical protein J4Q44_G00390030 [Coregonus suidteri]|uniref:Uncharacterized protein n=1 Tax=Coregonus suidteri TaxID=861788 RepID=A0AAN8Q3R7_9TELE
MTVRSRRSIPASSSTTPRRPIKTLKVSHLLCSTHWSSSHTKYKETCVEEDQDRQPGTSNRRQEFSVLHPPAV